MASGRNRQVDALHDYIVDFFALMKCNFPQAVIGDARDIDAGVLHGAGFGRLISGLNLGTGRGGRFGGLDRSQVKSIDNGRAVFRHAHLP
ncbi:MAG TPA: hypothetical protein VIF02_16620, partial [Methylocella sp.]